MQTTGEVYEMGRYRNVPFERAARCGVKLGGVSVSDQQS
jgi:hypothetical protein